MRKNYFLIILFLVSLVGVLWLFSGFLKGALVAWLLMMVTQSFAGNIDNYLANSKRKSIASHSAIISATILTIVLLMVLFIPLIYLASYAVTNFNYQKIIGLKSSGMTYLSSITWISPSIKEKLISLLTSYTNDLTGSEHLKQIWAVTQNYLTNLSHGVFNLGLIVIMFFLFHLYRKDITTFFAKLIPLNLVQQNQLYRNVSGTISIVFLTIFAVAVSQGIAFAFLMIFFDYNPLLLGFFTAIASVVPVFGTALVWIPVVINEVAHGNIVGAIVIACFGSFVLAFLIDNFVRLLFLRKISTIVKVDYQINEFLLFFAIAAGMASFGFYGVLIGPALIALFVALANSLND